MLDTPSTIAPALSISPKVEASLPASFSASPASSAAFSTSSMGSSSMLSIRFWVSLASPCSRFSACSVAMISRCRPLYCASVASPLANCACTCFSASRKASSFSSVLSMESLRSSYFCRSNSVLPGSIFKSRSTSFSWDWVDLISLLTPERALDSPVVSPPISTVMPWILLGNFSTSCKKRSQPSGLGFDGILLPVIRLFREHIVHHADSILV